jgi:conjugal transfer pilus assembly protein TraL
VGAFIPRYMDALPQILWWELDELVILFLSFFLGLITRQLTTLLIVGVISTFILAKLRTARVMALFFIWPIGMAFRLLRSKACLQGRFGSSLSRRL